MVDAANLETRLSIEPPAPPPVDQSDDSPDADAGQGFQPTSGDVPISATDSVDISDAARSIGQTPDVAGASGTAEFSSGDLGDDGSAQNDSAVPSPAGNAESPVANDGVAAQPSLQTSATEPIAPGVDDPLETNQSSSLALEEAGNDTLNETEAGRTLGQVIDVFA